jgi:hypothetical protein
MITPPGRLLRTYEVCKDFCAPPDVASEKVKKMAEQNSRTLFSRTPKASARRIGFDFRSGAQPLSTQHQYQ